MKHLLLFVAFVIGFASWPTATFAKDKSDDWRKTQKELRNEVSVLQKKYDIYKDRVKYMGGDRRQWQALEDVHADVNRMSAQVESGDFDVRDIRSRIQRANDNFLAIQAQLDSKANRPSAPSSPNRPSGGGFYQPPN